VKDMYRWVLEEGLSARKVARRLNAQGVRPPRAQRWTGATVVGILTNTAYTGTAIYNRLTPVEPVRPRKPGAYRKVAKSSYLVRPQAQWLSVPVPAVVDEAA
jgi:hypothetical protein